MFQHHRCCAFDNLRLPNGSAGYPGLAHGLWGTTPSVLRFLSAIRRECSRYTHAFSEKAQHLWRWISLRMFTQGRLVPRQPRAIKSTTRTELRNESIRGDRCVHWSTGMTPTSLRSARIHHVGYIHWYTGIKHTALRRYNIQNCEYIHWNTGITPTALRRYNIQNCEYIHYNIGIKYTALRGARIHHVGYIHWNTGITPTALPIGNTLNIDCLHLKNMNIYVDVWAFISLFRVSIHIHFMPFTYKTQLAK